MLNLFIKLFIASLVLFGCGEKKVTTTAVVNKYQSTSHFYGKVEPDVTQIVTSPVSGIIKEINHHPGEIVSENDWVVVVESEEAEKSLLGGLAKKANLESKFSQVSQQLKVYKELLEAGAVSQNEYDDIKHKHHSYQYEMVEVNHQLMKICPMLSDNLCQQPLHIIEQALPLKLKIHPQTSGTLSAIEKENPMERFKSIKQNEGLFAVSDMSRIKVRILVNDDEINLFHNHQPITINIPAQNITLQGKVISSRPLSDNNGQNQFQVTVQSDKAKHAIRLGAKAAVILPESNSYWIVPRASISSSQGHPQIEKILEKGQTKVIPIKIIKHLGRFCVISGPVKANDLITNYDSSQPS